MKPIKPSEVLRRAAQRVEDYPYTCGCYALSTVWEELTHKAWELAVYVPGYAYFVLFCPVDRGHHELWFPIGVSGADQRIIALCMAAAIAESEGN